MDLLYHVEKYMYIAILKKNEKNDVRENIDREIRNMDFILLQQTLLMYAQVIAKVVSFIS
jgi:hypothetical protein